MFKWPCLLIVIILVSIVSGCQDSNNSNQKAYHTRASAKEEAYVIRCIDGDTFIAEINGKQERIRLILVDTPETVHPNKPVQPFGKEASDFTKKMLEHHSVYLEYDKEKRDKYNRLLAYVYLTDGSSFNQELLEKGYARLAVFPPNTKYQEQYSKAEKTAKQKHRGVWGDESGQLK
ncbi:thermonuclease family protein [Bacillus velezensis]|uniref:thermonuclease family protein n=1 Tax=Bacillus amyloliquefaciens group TaxID=1938374 RepID=UPI000E23FB54|nr:thermonuclease family protein [Bacillus amyloliquefaciens]RDY83180.1 thermonuclease [Bacillus amyloliquefaciens]